VSEDEWELRKIVLWNHDATTRYRMFKGLKNDDQAKQFKKQINDLRSQTGQNAIFCQLDQGSPRKDQFGKRGVYTPIAERDQKYEMGCRPV
jgi:hypothetical protein